MIDFHSHFLPGIDDGSKNSEMSVQMLKMMIPQKISDIVATPHFYADQTDPETFVRRREHSFERLKTHLEGIEGIPEIRLGAEVAYFEGIADCETLTDLMIRDTCVLLLEMPVCRWNARILREVAMIYENHRIIPLIAHIDRYMRLLRDFDLIDYFDNLPVIIQANASFFNERSTRKKAIKMLEKGKIHILGSDCHNTDSRSPNMGECAGIIGKYAGDGYIEKITDLSRTILNNDRATLEAQFT